MKSSERHVEEQILLETTKNKHFLSKSCFKHLHLAEYISWICFPQLQSLDGGKGSDGGLEGVEPHSRHPPKTTSDHTKSPHTQSGAHLHCCLQCPEQVPAHTPGGTIHPANLPHVLLDTNSKLPTQSLAEISLEWRHLGLRIKQPSTKQGNPDTK